MMEPMEVDPYVYPWSCEHLTRLKSEDMILSYELLHAFYVACIKKNSWARKKSDCICSLCEENTSQREKIHACLSCIFFGCFKGHIQKHSAEQNHYFAMDTDSGHVFCFKCRDYKYDPDFMKVARDQHEIASRQRSIKTGLLYKWKPLPEEINLLQYHELVFGSEIGVKGTVNIGTFTCYMNVIVQCLIYAPAFRDFLLSYEHKICAKCKEECFTCCMANIVQESFSGDNKPFVLSDLLYLLFKRCKTYTIKKFNDADECFGDFIKYFHDEETRDLGLVPDPCDCIIHNLFGYEFRSELTCSRCGYVTDLSDYSSFQILLNFLPVVKKKTPRREKLVELLERSLTEELEMYTCPGCNQPGYCAKQSIPKKLPCIIRLCIQQEFDRKLSNTILEYEETLDMSQYMLSLRMKNWKAMSLNKELEADKHDAFKLEIDELKKLEEDKFKYQYYLYAVVEFVKGEGDDGHYQCYIRMPKQRWVFCNNEDVKPADEKKVLAIQHVRILFYHRKYM